VRILWHIVNENVQELLA